MNEQPVPQRLTVDVPDEVVAGHYADFVAAWHTPDVFVLDFAAYKGAPQLAEDETGPFANIQGRVVCRVRIPPQQVFELMKALENQLTMWEQRTGQRPPLGDDLPPV